MTRIPLTDGGLSLDDILAEVSPSKPEKKTTIKLAPVDETYKDSGFVRTKVPYKSSVQKLRTNDESSVQKLRTNGVSSVQKFRTNEGSYVQNQDLYVQEFRTKLSLYVQEFRTNGEVEDNMPERIEFRAKSGTKSLIFAISSLKKVSSSQIIREALLDYFEKMLE